jgi:CHAD domain-containing protein
MRKKGKALAQLDAPNRHKLRIQVKKLRYAAEFFGDLFKGKQVSQRRKKFVAALEHLRMGSATSTTSRWTRTSSRQRASGGNARIPNAPSPLDC